MSFLSLLLFASAVYFAHGFQFIPWEFRNAGYPASFNPVEKIDPSTYKEQTSKFLQDVGTAIDTHIKPLMSKLDERKQEQLKNMGLKEVSSFVDYIFAAQV